MAGLGLALADPAAALPRTFDVAGYASAPTTFYLNRLSVAPDGAHVYADAPNSGSRIAIFARDSLTGALSFVGEQLNAGPPTVSPDGAHVYTIQGHDIGVYARNVGTGALTPVELETSSEIFEGELVLSPDGASVYVTAPYVSGVAAFSRDAGTGELTFVELEQDGDDLVFPRNVAVSPDGAHVYVGSFSGTVLVFSRDGITGALTFASSVGGGVYGIGFIQAVRVSPDGTRVYVSADGGSGQKGTLTVLARDAGTGALTFVEQERGGEGGVPQIGGFLAVSPDGELLLTGNGFPTAVFARQGSGKVAFVEGVQADPGSEAPYDTAFSPDGQQSYIAGYTGSPGVGAVEILTAGFAGCESGPLTGCRMPGGGTLRIRATRGLVWRWTRGADTPPGALGDPTSTTNYALCVYDESGPTPALALRALVPAAGDCSAGPPMCWSPSTGGFRYRDPHRTPEGLFDMTLKSGLGGAARITVRGTGANLVLPTLPLGVPLRVQLESSTGECWEGIYSTPRANDATRFVARPD